MADAPFKPRDVVIYEHTTNGDSSRNGSLGVVVEIDQDSDPIMRWILPIGPVVRSPYSHNLRKIGELPDGTDI